MAAGTRPIPAVARVGRYEMGAEIAAGGMATVYLARASGPSGFEKLVALKRVHPHLAKEPAFVDMFLDEARIASRIQHPNVCQVFDFGEADGEYFIGMEFLVGESLSRVLRAVASSTLLNDPRRPYITARLMADACEGLHAAHELRGKDGELLNVVHRDVSPQNIFITYDGNAKIVDFGIASASDRLHQTSTGTVKGKFAYMSPEQAMGKRVDRRADVWALGVILWELLAFERLFRRETPAETLVALINEEIPPPSSISPLAPPELDAIVLKALARDIDQRYPSARELGRDLMRTLGRTGGDLADRAEVAEWLEALFPDGRKRHEQLIENARWGEPPEQTEVSSPSAVSDIVSRSSWSGVKADDVMELSVAVDPSDPSIVQPKGSPAEAERPAGSLTPPPMPGAPAFAPSPGVNDPTTNVPVIEAEEKSKLPWIALVLVALIFTVGGVSVAFIFGSSSGDGPVASAGGPATNATAPGGSAGTPTTTTEAQGDQSAGDGSDVEGARGDAPGGEPDPEGDEATQADENANTAGDGPTAPLDEDQASDDADDASAVRAARIRERRAARRRGRTSQAEPQSAPAADPSGPGTVIVSTPGGWANVYDRNGRFLGETPLTLSLPAGRHRLSLRPFGQPPSRNVTVNVEPGRTARVNQSL